MRGPEALLQHEDNWESNVGGSVPGERVVFLGQDLHVDLGDVSWMELYVYSIAGRRFSEDQVKLLNAIWVNTSFPDPRIWNNRVAALCGTVRSTVGLAVGAAVSVSDATMYGQPTRVRASDFFWRTKAAVDRGGNLKEIIDNELAQRKIIYGYGRPIVGVDERISHLMAIARSLGLDNGHFVHMAFEIEQLLAKKHSKPILNIVGLATAFTADMGFTAQEYCMYCTLCFTAGMMPCFLDTTRQREGTFLPVRCTQMKCGHIAPRNWG